MVETKQTEDAAALAALVAEVRALRAEVAALRDEQARARELVAETWDEWMPIAKLALDTAAARLEDLERRGVLAFGRELVGVGARVVEHFGPDDVRALGDAVVAILRTVRTYTQPGMLSLAQEAAAAVEGARADDKLGVFGMWNATRDADVQHGAALAFGVLRRVGRAARAGAGAAVAGRPAGWSRLQARLGPSGAVAPAPRAAAAGASRTSAAPSPAGTSEASAAPPVRAAGAIPPPAGFEGLPWDSEGFLADPAAHSDALAAALAAQHGLQLSADHLGVITAARAHAAAAGAAPNVRKLTQVAAITTRELYALFPDRPGSTVARIAGLRRPAGCI